MVSFKSKWECVVIGGKYNFEKHSVSCTRAKKRIFICRRALEKGATENAYLKNHYDAANEQNAIFHNALRIVQTSLVGVRATFTEINGHFYCIYALLLRTNGTQ